MEKLRILNLALHNWTFQEFLEQLEAGVVVTPNIDHFVKLQKDKEFYECYVNSEHIVCDSRAIQLLSRFLYPGKGVAEQIAGSDLFPAYCEHHKDNTDNVKVFLLGGTEESVEIAMQNINHNTNSHVVVAGYSPPFGFEKSEEESKKIVSMVNKLWCDCARRWGWVLPSKKNGSLLIKRTCLTLNYFLRSARPLISKPVLSSVPRGGWLP